MLCYVELFNTWTMDFQITTDSGSSSSLCVLGITSCVSYVHLDIYKHIYFTWYCVLGINLALTKLSYYLPMMLLARSSKDGNVFKFVQTCILLSFYHFHHRPVLVGGNWPRVKSEKEGRYAGYARVCKGMQGYAGCYKFFRLNFDVNKL